MKTKNVVLYRETKSATLEDGERVSCEVQAIREGIAFLDGLKMKYLKRLEKAQAQQDYRDLAAQVTAEGRPELAEKYAPDEGATLAQIEAAISDLRNEALGPINPYVFPTD